MFELLCILIAVFVAYLVAVYFVVKYTLNIGARSGLFGAGLVNIVTGFLLHDVVDLFIGYYLYDSPSLLYLAFRFGFLILGISGIIMVAVDLLRAIADMGNYISSVDDRTKKNADTQKTNSPSAQSDNIPAWKRIEMDAETQTKD